MLTSLINGDIVKCKSHYFWVKHFGVFVRDNEGNPKIIHCTTEKNVEISDYHTFFQDREIIVYYHSPVSGISYDDMIKKYDNLKTKKYRLFNYDCQDFVSELTGDIGTWIRPKQIYAAVSIVTSVTIIITGILLIRKSMKKRNSP